jgi:hypothetical protein
LVHEDLEVGGVLGGSGALALILQDGEGSCLLWLKTPLVKNLDLWRGMLSGRTGAGPGAETTATPLLKNLDLWHGMATASRGVAGVGPMKEPVMEKGTHIAPRGVVRQCEAIFWLRVCQRDVTPNKV